MEDFKHIRKRSASGPSRRKKEIHVPYGEDKSFKFSRSKGRTQFNLGRRVSKQSKTSAVAEGFPEIPAATESPRFRFVLGISVVLFLGWVSIGITWQSFAFFGQMTRQLHTEGNRLLSDLNIYQISDLNKDSYLQDVDTYVISKRILLHPAVEEVRTRKIYPESIHIQVQEYRPYAFLKWNRNYFLIDKKQRPLVRLIDPVEETKLPLLVSDKNNDLQLGFPMNSLDVQKGLDILEALEKSHFPKETISSINVTDPLNLTIKHRPSQMVLHVGRDNYMKKLMRFSNLYSQIRQQNPKATSIDLRDLRKIVVRD